MLSQASNRHPALALDALHITDATIKTYAANTAQPRAFDSNGRQYCFEVRRMLSARRTVTRWSLWLAGWLVLAAPGAGAAALPAIVPNPAGEVRLPGEFRLSAATRLVVPPRDASAAWTASYLRRLLGRSTGIRLARPTTTARRGAIRFVRRPLPGAGREGYRLQVDARGIAIEAPTDAGLLYGAISLWQIVPVKPAARAVAVPAVRIDDAPRFRWRGLLLDSVRQFQPPREIRRVIDGMAVTKLNVLHWHLPDDQGWRFARDIDPRTARPRRNGGFYSAHEVRSIVAYAARRNVTIVPESEMPGHGLNLDDRQSRSAREPPGRGRVVTLAELYRDRPMPPGLTYAERAHVLGVQGNLRTEYLRTASQLERVAFPRAAAIAEIGWSRPTRRHWRDFVRRLVPLERRYRLLDLRYSPATFRVRARAAYDYRAATALVRLSTQAGYGTIRYTLAGGTPRADSARYRGPLRLRLPVTLRAADFAGAQRIGPILTRRFDLATAQRRTSAQLSLCTRHRSRWIEGAPSATGARRKFLVDAADPCWVYRAADLDAARSVRVAVGRLRVEPPRAPGALVIRLDGCAGALLARLPLPRHPDAVTVLPAVPVPSSVRGLHDLCVRLPRSAHGGHWALAWIALEGPPPR